MKSELGCDTDSCLDCQYVAYLGGLGSGGDRRVVEESRKPSVDFSECCKVSILIEIGVCAFETKCQMILEWIVDDLRTSPTVMPT